MNFSKCDVILYVSNHLQRHSASRKLVARDLRTQSGSKWDFNYSFAHSVV